MKTKLAMMALVAFLTVVGKNVIADEQKRNVEPFSEISLRVSGNLFLKQGDKQSIEIDAKASTLNDIITEVKDRKLIIRFPNKNLLWKDFDPGKIIIYVTVPEINALNVSGSGDIICEDGINSRIIDLSVSGSGDIKLDGLKSEQVKAVVSGSGDVVIKGSDTATDLSVTISGSGNFNSLDFPAEDVNIKVSGSGNSTVHAKNKLTAKVAGSGEVRYRGKPLVDQSVVGSGSVKRID